jgi:hypothetical protein
MLVNVRKQLVLLVQDLADHELGETQQRLQRGHSEVLKAFRPGQRSKVCPNAYPDPQSRRLRHIRTLQRPAALEILQPMLHRWPVLEPAATFGSCINIVLASDPKKLSSP